MTIHLVHIENMGRHLFSNPYSGGIITTDAAGAEVLLRTLEENNFQGAVKHFSESFCIDIPEAAKKVSKFLNDVAQAGLIYEPGPESWEQLPGYAIILATAKCSISCEHCEFESAGKDTEMGTEEMKTVIDRLVENGVEHIMLGGADPLMREDIVDIIYHIRKRCAFLSISTPLARLDAKVLDAMREGCDVRVRLDGASPDTAEWNRERGSFGKTMDNMLKLQGNGIGFCIASRIFTGNIGDIGNLCDMAERLGCKWIGFERIKRSWSGEDMARYTPSTEEIEKAFSYINYKSHTMDGTVVVCKELDILKRGRREDPEIIRTDIGRRFIAVDSSGNVIPHPSLHQENYRLGSALKDDIQDIWANNHLLKRFRDTPVDDIDGCRDCDFKYICGGGPREEALLEDCGFLSRWSGCARIMHYLGNRLNLILFHDLTHPLLHRCE